MACNALIMYGFGFEYPAVLRRLFEG